MRVKLMDEDTLSYLQKLAGAMYDMVERGENPNEALKKVASDHNLSPDYIRVVGRAYNSGITNYLIHQERDLKKLAQFQVCDPEGVIRQLYKIKKKADDEYCSDEYLIPASAFNFRKEEFLFDKPPTPQRDRSDIYKFKEARGLLQKAASNVDDLRYLLYNISRCIDDEIKKIANYYKSLDPVDPDIVIETCETINIPIARGVLKKAGVQKDNRKQYKNYIPSLDAPPISHIKRAYYLARRLKALSESYHEKRAELNEVQKLFDAFKPKNTQQKSDSFFFQKSAKGKESSSGAISDISKGFQETTEEQVKKVVEYATEPKQLSEGLSDYIKEDNAILGHIIITDLMANDPVISNYDPELVLNIYKQVVQLAPNIVAKQDILRMVMRKLLAAGQLEPTDISYIVNLDRNLGTRAKTPEYYSPGKLRDL